MMWESGVGRHLWTGLGWLFVALGAAGVVLPLLPTTPFVLLAAWCFAKSSPRLHAWLLGHRLFGPLIVNWQRHGAIPRRAKWVAIGSMAAVFGLSLALHVAWPVLAVQALALAGSGAFILTRPDGPKA